jgi:drug/metabolite transporter (DMT)-like permease
LTSPDEHKPPFPPKSALVLAVLAVSTGSLFVRFAHAEPLVAALGRCLISTLVLAAVGWRACAREWPKLTRGEVWAALGAGACLALHFASWITSLSYTSVASSVVIVNTTPLWVALLVPVLSTDRVRGRTVLAIAISIVGCAVIGADDFRLAGRSLYGDGLALVGAWSAALYFLAGRKLRRSLSLLPYVIACYGTAALLLLAVVLVSGERIVGLPPATYGWLVALALVPQVIGHSAYNYALRYVTVALTSVATLGENIGAPLLAWIFLGEPPGIAKCIGGAIIAGALLLAVRSERASD